MLRGNRWFGSGSACLGMHLSGTLERTDGRAILWLPYRAGPKARTREVKIDAPGVEGGTKSGHPTAADQGPQRLILGVTRVTVGVSLLAVSALPGPQSFAAAVA